MSTEPLARGPAAEAIAAYHAMRPPRNVSEARTEAELLGLDLEEREMVIGPDGRGARTGPTLTERICAFWQPAAPRGSLRDFERWAGSGATPRPAAAPRKRRRGPARIPDDVIRRNAGSAKEYAP
jgi:hypothetical protein